MEQILNGVQKPADVIARGPHVYVEAEHKYKEAPQQFREYPRALYHVEKGYIEAQSLEQEQSLKAEGWQRNPIVAKPIQEAPKPTDASVVESLSKLVEQQARQITSMMANVQPPVVIPEEVKRGPGRPPKTPEPAI
jgi:hypothetical protein